MIPFAETETSIFVKTCSKMGEKELPEGAENLVKIVLKYRKVRSILQQKMLEMLESWHGNKVYKELSLCDKLKFSNLYM